MGTVYYSATARSLLALSDVSLVAGILEHFIEWCRFFWRDSAASETMAKPDGDDLRRKFLLAYDQCEDTLEKLADRFLVSVGWAKKISAQRNRTGQAERVPHHSGRKLRAGTEAQRQVMDWVAAKPDLTLAQLQAKLHGEAAISLSPGRIWHLLKRLGLRLKKSRCTQSSATPKPTARDAKSSRHASGRSRRSG
jgi:transposase